MSSSDISLLTMDVYDSPLMQWEYDGFCSAMISELGSDISFSCFYWPQKFICNLRLQNIFNLPKVPDKYLILAHKAKKKYWKSFFQFAVKGLSIWMVLFKTGEVKPGGWYSSLYSHAEGDVKWTFNARQTQFISP